MNASIVICPQSVIKWQDAVELEHSNITSKYVQIELNRVVQTDMGQTILTS